MVGRICGRVVFSVEWKRMGVTDGESGDDGSDEITWVG